MLFRFLYPPCLVQLKCSIHPFDLPAPFSSSAAEATQHAPRAFHSFLHRVLLSPGQTGEDIRRRCICSAIWEQGWWRLSPYIPVPSAQHEYQLLQHA